MGRAQLLQQSGRIGEASAIYRDLISVDPLDAEAVHYLGMCEFQSGKRESGLDRIARSIVISPHWVNFYSNSAAIALVSGDFLLSRRDSQKALSMRADIVEARDALGWAHFRLNDLASSVPEFLRALVLDPSLGSSWNGLSMTRIVAGQHREALSTLGRVLDLNRNDEDALLQFGTINLNLGDRTAALGALIRVIVLCPDHSRGYLRLGVTWQRDNQFTTAIKHLDRAFKLEKYNALAAFNAGSCFDAEGNWESANEWYLRSRALDPSFADCDLAIGTMLFRSGQISSAWRYFDARWRSEALASKNVLTLRLETSRPEFSLARPDARVLVWAEQGLGDEIMYLGLLNEFREMCGETLVQVDRRLTSLVGRAFEGVHIFERGTTIPEDLYDQHIPMASLGKWLRPSLQHFIGKGFPYLSAQKHLARHFRDKLGVRKGETLIGLSWRSASPTNGAERSLGIERLVRSLKSSSVRFVNLQYGDVRFELDNFKKTTGLEISSLPEVDNTADIEGLAALIDACDLVVSVGNATAHLSGALGQKTWVLLPRAGAWRWLHEGTTCPWYASVRLFRQADYARWESVLDEIATAFRREFGSAR